LTPALLNAQEGAAIQGEQVRSLIQARVMLRSLEEDLDVDQPLVAQELKQMSDYLERLGDEYRENYYRLAWAQSVHEEFMKRQLSQPDLPKEPLDGPTDPWLVLKNYFPRVSDMLSAGTEYKKDYSAHYHRAKEMLRKQLATFSTEQPTVRDRYPENAAEHGAS